MVVESFHAFIFILKYTNLKHAFNLEIIIGKCSNYKISIVFSWFFCEYKSKILILILLRKIYILIRESNICVSLSCYYVWYIYTFAGAGLSSVVISFLMSTYHNVIIAYAIYYFFAAFRADVPWSRCDNSWNSPRCWLPSYGSIHNRTRPNLTRTPSEDFFEYSFKKF